MDSGPVRAGGLGLARHPILALGFRPFYLLAGLFATLALPLWIASYLGLAPMGALPSGMAWHVHEMAFGFATAVMAGFLLTAVPNWTGQQTPTGASLAGLAVLWVLARVLALTGPTTAAMLVDIAFLPVLGVTIAIPIWRSRNVRNFKIVAVLAGLAIANILYHLAQLNMLPAGLMRVAITAALDVITLLMAIIGGRIIPAFTANAVSAARPRRMPSVEALSFGSLVLILAAGILGIWYPLPAGVWLVLLTTAALAHAVRLLLWDPLATRRNALLWMLHAAYAWIPITMALRACAQAFAIPPAAAFHALTVGGMSGLMVAMMMRTALGHTGRALTAGSAEIAVFALVQAAAIGRVLAGFIRPEFYQGAVVGSGILWSLAFVVFLFRYWPILTRPRIDGRSN
jgi:uncharacterized protein involved in response to NO